MSEQLYREQGKTAEQVICPACQRPVVVDQATTATCSHCAHAFAVNEATTLVEYTAAQNLALVLKDALPPARDDTAVRFAIAGGAVAAIALLGVAFGTTGLVIAMVLTFVAIAVRSTWG